MLYKKKKNKYAQAQPVARDERIMLMVFENIMFAAPQSEKNGE